MNNAVHSSEHESGQPADIVPVAQPEPASDRPDHTDPAGVGSGPVVDTAGPTLLERAGPGATQPPSSWQNPLRSIGVSQIRYEYRCKICQLSSKAPTLYKKLHELVFTDRMSWNQAMNEVNTYIKQHGMQLQMLNTMNMSGHFNKHIQIEDPVVAAYDKFDQNVATPPIPAAVRALVPLVNNAHQSDVDDYRNMDAIRQKITAQLEKLEAQLDVVDPKTNQKKLDKWALELYTKVVKETRACIVDLNDMRKSERLMNSVVQALLDRLTFAIIPQLLSEYTMVVEELDHAQVPKALVDRIDDRLRRKTAEIIANTARAAVTEVQRQFRLR